ncbi:MAG: hypothetical protein A2Y62_01060 [Candidatus Fischerbacteria bacterium RBG_13_37_8]|uniref:DUF2442 domain-containing protein n=1 Tax=Candidatus Fischerbacteria bacterium RBG_13_37_8 TaxID=1817863 RepID=A0A1F5VU38_9BACT|nr:MAG: hypothetical protein A2Y62_01060 [Candidatus Fischerbacteria bacterium RBG_13_37_8]
MSGLNIRRRHKVKKVHKIGKLRFTERELIIIIDNKKYSFNMLKISDKLAHATEPERDNYNISPSGYGIHWPLLDEDLSIDGLLGIKHLPMRKKHAVGI